MRLSIVVAMDDNRLIGSKNQLPWHLPADLVYFKKLTTGKSILMGRKTYDSIGRPLPNRRNIVVTRNTKISIPGCEVVSSVANALELTKGEEEVMVIGGASLCEQLLPQVNRLYITKVDGESSSSEGSVTGRNLSSTEEETEADQLRLAVAESLCRSPEKRKRFGLATTAISFEMPIETYCKRILTPTFWGGEPELLVLAEILKRPITVYIPAAKARNAASQAGFVPIQTYGADFSVTKKGNTRKPVRLLYNGENHYDVLI